MDPLAYKITTKIRDLKPGMRGIRIESQITRKGEPYQISTRYGVATVSDAEIEDSSGRISWRLWRHQVNAVRVGDRVAIENAFVRSVGEKLEVNLGSDGSISVLESSP